MTPKEKAIELVKKYEPYCYHERIQCAIITVDEILSNMIFWDSNNKIGLEINKRKYWKEVKKEIKNL